MSELTEKRTPELIGAEIRMYYEAGRRVTMLCGIEIGRRLVEAKEMLQHGEWLPWLERETTFSERHAQNYMKVFREYGAAQLGLFGPETNAKYIADLPISKAIALISVPENERVEFAEEVDAEHISIRELEQKIRERDTQLAESEKLREETSELLKTQDGMLAEAKKQIAELAKLNDELEKRPVEVAVETVRDEEAIAAAAKEAREKAEAEAVKAANKVSREHDKTLKELNEKIAGLKKQMNKAEDERAEAGKETERLKAELEEARKALKTSDATVTAFGIRFNTVQSEWSYMMAEVRKAEAQSAETGAKLREAVRQLLEYLKQDAEET